MWHVHPTTANATHAPHRTYHHASYPTPARCLLLCNARHLRRTTALGEARRGSPRGICKRLATVPSSRPMHVGHLRGTVRLLASAVASWTTQPPHRQDLQQAPWRHLTRISDFIGQMSTCGINRVVQPHGVARNPRGSPRGTGPRGFPPWLPGFTKNNLP